jgi:PAS domain S-box-containing protein
MKPPPRPQRGLDLALALLALAAATSAALVGLAGAPDLPAGLALSESTRGPAAAAAVLLATLAAGLALARWRGARGDVAPSATGATRAGAGASEADDALDALLHAAPLAMAVIDPDPPTVRLWNPAAERLFGWRAEELVGRPLPGVPSEHEEELQAYRRILASGRPETDREVQRPRADGSLVEVRMSAAPLPAATAGAGRLLLIFSDLTARRQAERALLQSDATLRAVYDSTPVCMGVVELALDGRNILHVYDNPITCRLFGLAPGGSENRLASSLGASPETVAVWIEHYRRAEAEGAPVRFEFEVPGPGERRWFEASVSCIGPGPSGRMRYCYVADDVTARHRAAQRLQESEATARLALQVARLGTWSWSAAEGTVRLDRRAAEIFGLPDMHPRSPGRLFDRVHPEDRERLRERWKDTLARRDDALVEEEFRVLPPDGAPRWVLARAQRLGGGPRPQQLLGTLLDTTERKLAEQALRSADRRKDEFLATLAHELHTPLAPIRNGVHLLRRTAAGLPAAQAPLDTMERQVAHMARLLDDLIDISRVTRDELVLRTQRVPLADVMRQAVEGCRAAVDAAGHALELRLPDAGVGVEADPVRLAQAIGHLLHNAAKYTPPGGHIVLEGARDGPAARVTVTDDGLGIPPEMLARIFEPFTQVEGHPERARGGLGIGLTLARRLAELHGGRLEAHSEGTGRGSRFALELPACGAPAAAPAAPPAPLEPSRPRRVLVADDDPDTGESLGHFLRLAGNPTTVVRDGLQALRAAEALHPEVALLDLGMTGLSGYEVARRLRTQDWGRAMLLIAVTGWGQTADRVLAEAAGFDHHVVKPFEPEELETLLATPDVQPQAAPAAGGAARDAQSSS